ncbi:MAG: alpha/beta hydrolase [Dehalococcoidia bacterium]
MPFLDTNGIRLHYLDRGAGPPLVWLPGGNDHAAMALRAHERLLDRWRIVAVDPRGQGGTTAFVTAASYEPSLLAEDLRGLLDALGLRQVVIGGHSRGGRSALEFARAYPERVGAVIAVDAPALASDAERRLAYRRMAQRLRERGIDAFISVLPTAPRDPRRRAEWEAHLRAAGAEAVAAQYEAMAALRPITEDMTALTMPLLIICGERDPLLADAVRSPAPRRVPTSPSSPTPATPLRRGPRRLLRRPRTVPGGDRRGLTAHVTHASPSRGSTAPPRRESTAAYNLGVTPTTGVRSPSMLADRWSAPAPWRPDRRTERIVTVPKQVIAPETKRDEQDTGRVAADSAPHCQASPAAPSPHLAHLIHLAWIGPRPMQCWNCR